MVIHHGGRGRVLYKIPVVCVPPPEILIILALGCSLGIQSLGDSNIQSGLNITALRRVSGGGRIRTQVCLIPGPVTEAAHLDGPPC